MQSIRTRGDMLRFAVAFALRSARKLVRGLRHELNEAERFRVADDVVYQLQQHGDPWRLKDDLPPPSRGHDMRMRVRSALALVVGGRNGDTVRNPAFA